MIKLQFFQMRTLFFVIQFINLSFVFIIFSVNEYKLKYNAQLLSLFKFKST